MFAFSQVEPRTRGRVSSLDLPSNRFFGAAWDQGMNDSGFASVYRMSELWLEQNDSALFGLLQWDNGPKLKAEEANARAKEMGLPLKFDEDVFEGAFRLMSDRKRKELDRQFYMNQGEQSAGKFIGGMGTQMLASMLNPIDFGLMFVPIVGQAKYAKGAAMMGRGALRRTLARGLVTTEEKIAAKLGSTRLIPSFIEGTVGQSLVEIPLFVSNVQDQADYTANDFVTNIVAGGAFAGVMRYGLEGAARVLRRLDPKTKEAAFRKAVDQFLKGEDTDVTRYVELDEGELRRQATFDEAAARSRAKQQVDTPENLTKLREQAVAESHPIPREKSVSNFVGTRVSINNEQGILRQDGQTLVFETDKRIYELGNIDELKNVIPDQLGIKVDDINVKILDDKRILVRGEVYQNLFHEPKQAVSVDADGNKVVRLSTLDEVPQTRTFHGQAAEEIAYQLELSKNLKNIEPLDIPQARDIDPEIINKRATQLREQAIKKLIEQERRAWDPEKRYNELRQEEIQRQLQEGKVLRDEEIERYTSGEEVTERDVSTVEEDVKNLEEQLKQQEPETELEKIDIQDDQPYIEQAVNCLVTNG